MFEIAMLTGFLLAVLSQFLPPGDSGREGIKIPSPEKQVRPSRRRRTLRR